MIFTHIFSSKSKTMRPKFIRKTVLEYANRSQSYDIPLDTVAIISNFEPPPGPNNYQ